MHLRHTIIGLSLSFMLVNAAPISAQDERFQHQYAEKSYAPIPSAFATITQRLKAWNLRAEEELQILQTATHPKVTAWRAKIMAIDTNDEKQLLEEINTITNAAVTYRDDYDHYNKDFWAPPFETLTEGGDCEDIALLKAVALHMHGWDMTDRGHVLVGMVDFHGKPTAHAVLEVKLKDNIHYVMRSLRNSVVTFDDMDHTMKPLYLVSSKNLVVFKDGNKKMSYLLTDAEQNTATAAGEETPKETSAD